MMILTKEQGEQIKEFCKTLLGDDIEILIAIAKDEDISITTRTVCTPCFIEGIINALEDAGRYNHTGEEQSNYLVN